MKTIKHQAQDYVARVGPVAARSSNHYQIALRFCKCGTCFCCEVKHAVDGANAIDYCCERKASRPDKAGLRRHSPEEHSRNALIIDSGYQAYAREEGHYDFGG